MLHFTSATLRGDVARHLRAWFRLLAHGQWAQACAMLDEPNSYGTVFTPGELRRVLALNYNFKETDHFTDPDDLPSDGRFSIVAYADGSGYDVEYDVPLNGAWTDLSAQFQLLHRPSGFALILHDLHVL